jgi:hypothetical protein
LPRPSGGEFGGQVWGERQIHTPPIAALTMAQKGSSAAARTRKHISIVVWQQTFRIAELKFQEGFFPFRHHANAV